MAIDDSATLGVRRLAASYTGLAGRDLRIDIMRGGALVMFAIAVLTKVADPASQAFDSTATVTAVALIVTLEGALLGMLYRPRLATRLGESALRVWQRARSWYLVSLSVVVGVVLLELIPGLDTHPITELTTAGQPFLFGRPPADEAGLVVGYPLDPDVLLSVVLLRVGPWPLDVAVLLFSLFMIAPLFMLALSKGRWRLLLVLSAVFYVIEILTTVRLLPTRAEANLPILGWQFVFVVGMVAGYYRRELVQWFRRGPGLALFLLLSVAAVAWLALPAVLSLTESRVDGDVLSDVAGPQAGWLFEASAPGPLRVLLAAVMIMVAYGALTVAWRPLSLLVGWLLAPIGSAVLPALVLLVCAAISTSNFAIDDAVYLPAPVIAAVIVLVMWAVSLIWRRMRNRKVQR